MKDGTAHGPGAPDCATLMDRLFDFLDGELGPDAEARFREHLASCRHCFENSEFEKRFLEALHAARSKETCPGKLRSRVLDSLRRDGWSGTASGA